MSGPRAREEQEMSDSAPFLGDPTTMRPANHRTGFGYGDPLARYDLADGRKVWLTWLPINQTHTHIVAWVEDSGDEPLVVSNIPRFNAGRESEKLLRSMEEAA